jgi:hypothetical protein
MLMKINELDVSHGAHTSLVSTTATILDDNDDQHTSFLTAKELNTQMCATTFHWHYHVHVDRDICLCVTSVIDIIRKKKKKEKWRK